MSREVECPYCEEWQEICHDDGFGYAEGVNHEMKCADCGKNFVFQTSISFYYDAEKADCLNGSEHNMIPVMSTIRNIWPDWKRCKDCGHEVRGQYVDPDNQPRE